MKNKIIISLIFSLIITSQISLAESIMYSTTVTQNICPTQDGASSGRCSAPGVINPHIDIQYNVRVTNADTGTVIPCNSTVPVGTKLKYQILQHKTEDVYWFGTGGAWDSPYGDWINNAAPPPPDTICQPKNLYFPGSTYNNFASLSVSPPISSIKTDSSMNCLTQTDGSKICTANSQGTTNTTFDFLETKGYFYFGESYTSTPQNGKCDVYRDQTPAIIVFRQGSYGGTYRLDIPKQELKCNITIGNSERPSPPIITINGGEGFGQCTVNSEFTLTLTSKDPQGKSIRFEIDWNNDGTVDQVTQPSPSGVPVTVSRTFATDGPKTVSAYAVNSTGGRSALATINFICGNEIACSVCTMRNVCDQTFNGKDCGKGCKVPGVADINSSCISYFSCTSNSVNPNGSIECSWKTPSTVTSKCGFVDLTTPTPRPIPGLQNLDPGTDRARITNIQTTTRFCLICQFYSLQSQNLLGEAAVHQWVRVLRIGEN